MKEEQISGGFVVLVQGLMILFAAPFILFICYLLIKRNIETDGRIFLAIIIIAVLLTIRYVLLFADVYLSGENVIIKKFIGSKMRPTTQVRLIDESILPFTYYIEFQSGKKVYFRLKPTDIFNRFTGTDSDTILETLKRKFNLEN